MLRSLPLLTLLLAVSPAQAEPAAIPDVGQRRAERAFQEFASEWMQKVRTLEEESRSRPAVKAGATDLLFTYRGYGDDYSIELQPTGHARTPYVGLLRYTEHVYSCASMRAQSCTVASTVPVTEIFRYRNGRWSY